MIRIDIYVDSAMKRFRVFFSAEVDRPYKAGDTIEITVRFSEEVIVIKSPQLAMETGVCF